MSLAAIPSANGSSGLGDQMEALLRLTQEMFMVAERHDWGRLVELEAQRTLILSEIFATRPPTHNGVAMSVRVRQVLELNNHVADLSANGLRQLAVELANLGQGKRASDAYQQAAIR
jgi:hypothetical protein